MKLTAKFSVEVSVEIHTHTTVVERPPVFAPESFLRIDLGCQFGIQIGNNQGDYRVIGKK